MPVPKRLIDVSHTVEDGMVTYKGLPAPIICDWRSREEPRAIFDGAEFQVGIEMVANKRPVHTVLLAREIPIVEHLRGLGGVPTRGGRFTAVPVKVKGCGTFPVRAFVSAFD